MPSKKPYFALTLAVALLGIAAVSRPAAHAASATLTQPRLAELVSLCYHTDVSDYRCPGSDTSRSLARLPSEDALGVESISITVTEKGGRTYTNTLPATTDAIFLSRKSLRTFLLLHYLATDDKKFSALSAYMSKYAPSKAAEKKP